MRAKTLENYVGDLSNWIKLEKAAIELIHITGSLWLDKAVELVMFRKQLVDRSASEILNIHHNTHELLGTSMDINDTLSVAKELAKLDLAPSKIDIGKLTKELMDAGAMQNGSKDEFIKSKIGDFIGAEKKNIEPKDVVLYGFGRIGRLLARELISQAGKGEQLRLRAIVTRNNSDDNIIKRAMLLRNDSVHGPFPGTVIEDLENKCLVVNGHTIDMIAANDPTTIDYTSYGINDALIIDNTGVYRDREELGSHLKAKGAAKVLLTAPGKDDIPNVVYGVNQAQSKDDETIFSAASCTTNAIVPVLKVLDDIIGIENGHIETIHAYTNDQNLLDNYHKKNRRGRSAALNMVLTETGAAKAVSKALPQLSGKLTGNAVRVPTPDVSLAILNLNAKRETSVEEVNESLRQASLSGALIEQIHYSDSLELVSSDMIGSASTSIVDAPSTLVSENNKSMVVYAWYDNEYGYSRQVIRYAKFISKVRRLTYY
ncbi:MAG: glyceraldehyde-3-phosphate dehydrogenase [Bacteroidia bacterium]|nr:glyceraldehyde-3-phosphate dehydrogenase [Bacteroidia bacterium]